MVLLKVFFTFSIYSAAAQFDGGGDIMDFSSWKCVAQGEEENRKTALVAGDLLSTKKSAKENAYIQCRTMGYDDCQIISCQQTPLQF